MSALALAPLCDGVAEVLSPSQVNTYAGCTARWAYKYVTQLPDKGSPDLALGSAVDAAIKATWRHKLDTGIDLAVPALIDIFAEVWLKRIAGVEFTAKQDRDEMAKQGAALIALYMREAEPSIHPQAVDYHVQGTIAGVHVQGYLDLVLADGTVVDLKVRKRTPSALTPEELLQVTTYVQLAKDLDISGRARIDTLVRLKTPKLVSLEHDISLPDYHYARSRYPAVQAAMRTQIYLPNRSSFLCSRATCPYWRECEQDSGGIVKGGDPDAE